MKAIIYKDDLGKEFDVVDIPAEHAERADAAREELIDAVSHRPEAYPAADKLTKPAWLIILGVALAAHMIFWNPISFLNIIGTIAALVYVLDVRPALRALTRR